MWLYSLITLPEASTTIEQIGAWSKPWFNEFWQYSLVGIGIMGAGMGVYALVSAIINGFRDFKWNIRENRMRDYRNEAWNLIRQRNKIEADWDLWRNSQGSHESHFTDDYDPIKKVFKFKK